MSNVIPIKGASRPAASDRAMMETLVVTKDVVNGWRVPPFQRPVRINDKVKALAKEIADTEVIPGIVTLGRLKGDLNHLYIVDGQHRRESFYESGLAEALVDVRIVQYDSMAEMADAFVDLNTALVKMRPDDILRGLEGSAPPLRKIREACPFVGYDQVRRGTYSPILSMSVALRCWFGSAFETPTSNSNSASTRSILESLEDDSVEKLILYLRVVHEAWGKDPENYRLWAGLNLTMCAWIFRRLVFGQGPEMTSAKRTEKLTIAQFKKCMMALSADSNYVDWLVGRTLSERDRSPCYRRIKDVIVARLKEDGVEKPRVLQPSWANV